ncbi:efflux RND transporter periplasmic adaptor subunit [Planctomycetota bacterium]
MNKLSSAFGTTARKLRAVVPLVIGMVALVAIIAWLSGMFRPKIEPGQADVAVARLEGKPTDVVHEVTKDYIEEFVGTLKAASRTEVSAKVLATIETIAVTAGDVVSEGDVIVRLSSQEFDARLRQAEDGLQVAQATRVQAETDLRRSQELLAGKAIPKSQYDQVETNVKVAKAQESRAEQAVAEAKVFRSYATIKAPKAGRIVDKLAAAGDMARPGQPLLVLYDATSLRLEAPVLEKLAVKLKVGDKLVVYVDALDRDVKATIDEIVPQADAPSRSFLVKATLSRADDLYEGMFGRLLIPAGQRRHLCLATDAIQEVGQLQFVNVVRSDETLERRLVKTGRLGMPGRVEVLSGVSAGETVVIQQRDLTDTSSSEGNDQP